MTALALLAALAAPVAAQDDTSRDDDLFGEAGTAAPTDAEISDTLRAADQRLTVGGRIYLRANVYVPEDPEIETVVLDSPSLVDLFVDARPTDRLRGFAQTRVTHDPTVAEGDLDRFGNPRVPTTVALDQVWINASLGGTVFVTAGQQRVKWGAGRFWNPTDFLDPARLDALAFFDERTGVPLVKVHVPFEKAGLNLYGFAGFEGASAADEVQGALRAEWLVGLTEIALSTALRKGDPERFGGQVSTGLGPFDLKGEVAVIHEEDDWIPQAVGGVEWGVRYSDRDSLYLGAEVFFNDLGVDDPDLYPQLWLEGRFTPFYLGRHYAGAYLYLPAPGRADDHTFVLSTLGNLSDRSFVTRLDWSARLLTELSVNAYTQVHYGEIGEFRFALDALAIPVPLVDAGLGAAVKF